MQDKIAPYQPKNHIRIVTAASLFDGHDASINIMRRIIQATGVEVIHLGHDRSAEEVVNTAIEEDANGIALTSYQGGHLEYFKYMRDLLVEKGSGHIQIFGGGGGGDAGGGRETETDGAALRRRLVRRGRDGLCL